MDTIVGALHGKDSLNVEHIMHPQTQINAVIGLEAQLAKAITNLTASGGTITITKGDGTTSQITIQTGTGSGGGSATYNIATATADGLMSSEMFSKLQGIESGAQKNSTALATTTANGLMSAADKTLLNNLSSSSVTGVNGSAESSYRTGTVNLTAANVGAAASSHYHSASDISSGTLPVSRGGTGQTSLANVSVGSATKVTQDGNGNNIVNTYLTKTAKAASATSADTAATCTGNAATATKATQDESGNNIKGSYAASFSISDHTITLKNKNGTSLGTVTVPDNNTTNLTQMTGVLPIANGGTGNNTGSAKFLNVNYIANINLDELNDSGFFITQNATNGPSGAILSLPMIISLYGNAFGNKRCIQILIDGNVATNALYYRSRVSSGANSWKKLTAC